MLIELPKIFKASTYFFIVIYLNIPFVRLKQLRNDFIINLIDSFNIQDRKSCIFVSCRQDVLDDFLNSTFSNWKTVDKDEATVWYFALFWIWRVDFEELNIVALNVDIFELNIWIFQA